MDEYAVDKKGYCKECLRTRPIDKRNASAPSRFYCDEHLGELGIEPSDDGILERFMNLLRPNRQLEE